jgi:hypothetical protein
MATTLVISAFDVANTPGRRLLRHCRDRRSKTALDDHVEPALGWLSAPDHERLHGLNGAPPTEGGKAALTDAT